jgi:hypothetical protein
MGHSTPTVTANIYSDLYSDELDQVATNLDRLHRMLRHAKASMTLDVYADLFDTDLDAVAIELDAKIRAVAGKG